MEWSWNDTEIGEVTLWWTIDPQTGEPDDAPEGSDDGGHLLGECPIWAAGEAAETIEVTFGASRNFSDEETRALLWERVVPPSFRGGPEDAAELLELVESMWSRVDRCYRQALGRSPSEVERQFIFAHAFATLRPGGRKRPEGRGRSH